MFFKKRGGVLSSRGIFSESHQAVFLSTSPSGELSPVQKGDLPAPAPSQRSRPFYRWEGTSHRRSQELSEGLLWVHEASKQLQTLLLPKLSSPH